MVTTPPVDRQTPDVQSAKIAAVTLGRETANIDHATVRGFGEEWDAFDQSDLAAEEHQRLFDAYFSVFPFDSLPPSAEGFDLGCGSGRWAALLAGKVGRLHCIDPSEKALAVARRRLLGAPTTQFHLAGSDSIPLPDGSQDFGYSLGVLHHIPDTARAMKDCVKKLKLGAPFLVYLYYRFDNRPLWFRWLWKLSDFARRAISHLPFSAKKTVSHLIAISIYWPLARISRLMENLGTTVESFPLRSYRNASFYTMRTDALDRFGTRLEHRFTRDEVEEMMLSSGLESIVFRDNEPFWTACGIKAG